jgi:hypothetical protein
MRAYNLARLAHCFEPGRLNRALGIVQTNSTRLLPDGRLDVNVNDWHMASVAKCDCIDYQQHGSKHWCKHRIAAALIYRAAQLDETK